MPALLEQIWYGQHFLRWVLLPATFVYWSLSRIRRFFLKRFWQEQLPVPVIVVGNLSLGGVGKTPLVIALAQQLQAKGLRVGIISRGYGAKIKSFPHEVTIHSSALEVGDEPLLIARRTGCPVIIAPKRVNAAKYLLANYDPQVIISDDGLQHYALGRAIEIAVIDGMRHLGNGWCLPAGPLRESAQRLKEVDFVVVNGCEYEGAYSMYLQPGKLIQLVSGQEFEVESLALPVAAVAAIGHPQRFFKSLQELGLSFHPYPFPDHHYFKVEELRFLEPSVVMTEKDAIKCQHFAATHWFFLPVNACLSEDFWQALWSHEQLKGYFSHETSSTVCSNVTVNHHFLGSS